MMLVMTGASYENVAVRLPKTVLSWTRMAWPTPPIRVAGRQTRFVAEYHDDVAQLLLPMKIVGDDALATKFMPESVTDIPSDVGALG